MTDKFKSFIYNFLIIIANKNEVETVIKSQYFQYFNNAFTSSQIDKDNNYEVLEKLGDKFWDMVFADFLWKEYKNELKSQEIINNVIIYFHRNELFEEFAHKLEFDSFIKQKGIEEKKLYADVFEAMLAAIKFSFDENGFNGYKILYNFLSQRIFNINGLIKEKINLSDKYAYKNLFQTLVEKKIIISELTDKDDGIIIEIKAIKTEIEGKKFKYIINVFTNKNVKQPIYSTAAEASNEGDAKEKAAEEVLKHYLGFNFREKLFGEKKKIKKTKHETNITLLAKPINNNLFNIFEKKGSKEILKVENFGPFESKEDALNEAYAKYF